MLADLGDKKMNITWSLSTQLYNPVKRTQQTAATAVKDPPNARCYSRRIGAACSDPDLHWRWGWKAFVQTVGIWARSWEASRFLQTLPRHPSEGDCRCHWQRRALLTAERVFWNGCDGGYNWWPNRPHERGVRLWELLKSGVYRGGLILSHQCAGNSPQAEGEEWRRKAEIAFVLVGSAQVRGDEGSIPGLERSPGEWNGCPLQYPCLEKSMDRTAWQATVHGVAESQTQLSIEHSLSKGL